MYFWWSILNSLKSIHNKCRICTPVLSKLNHATTKLGVSRGLENHMKFHMKENAENQDLSVTWGEEKF